MLAILHFDGKHQIGLRSLRLLPLLYPLTHLPVLGRSHHPNIPTVFPIQIIHHPPEHDAVRSRILQTGKADDIVNHLVEQDALCLPVGHIVICTHGKLEIIEFGAPPSGGTLVGKLSQTGLGTGQPQLRNGQFAPEVVVVETPKPLFHPFYCYNHGGKGTAFCS